MDQKVTKCRFALIVKWLVRKKLEREITHYGRVANMLIMQINNDAEALAYAQIRQMIASALLLRLSK
jgi:hypothetical protein